MTRFQSFPQARPYRLHRERGERFNHIERTHLHPENSKINDNSLYASGTNILLPFDPNNSEQFRAYLNVFQTHCRSHSILKPPTAKIWSRSRTKRQNLGNKMWLMVSHLSFYGSQNGWMSTGLAIPQNMEIWYQSQQDSQNGFLALPTLTMQCTLHRPCDHQNQPSHLLAALEMRVRCSWNWEWYRHGDVGFSFPSLVADSCLNRTFAWPRPEYLHEHI